MLCTDMPSHIIVAICYHVAFGCPFSDARRDEIMLYRIEERGIGLRSWPAINWRRMRKGW